VLCVRGGAVVDGEGTRRADVLVAGGIVVDVRPEIEPPRGAQVLDATGCVVGPGLVDLHTHLREPGREDAETVESGARAAALGGYTAVVAMPNTEPAIDCAAAVRSVLALGAGACAEIAVAGAITRDRAGESLAPLAEMAALGVRIFTDDGRGVQDAGLMRRALEYARPLGVVLAQHCEDEALAAGGYVHEGEWSSRLGMSGQPALAEEAMVARDIALVRLTGTPVHFLHLSTEGSVRLVRAARAEGLPVTAEVTPHHLSLTHAALESFDPVFKVNPPLRTTSDVAALRAALVDGTIDAIATDHAPHPVEAKEMAFAMAPPGMTGLETALAVSYGALCCTTSAAADATPRRQMASRSDREGGERLAGIAPSWLEGMPGPRATLAQLFAAMSSRPARIAGLQLTSGQGGPIVAGAAAHLCVVDLDARWAVDAALTASRSHNTPFAGRELVGRVRHTVLAGEPVVLDGEAQR
jgi:dihydroorotase